jgi:transcriptional regulator with XRE-family HTH domain
MTFGDYIKEQREERGLTQGDLAKLTGVSQGAICQYEKGTITPRAGKVVALAQALGVSPDLMLERAGFYGEPRSGIEATALFRDDVTAPTDRGGEPEVEQAPTVHHVISKIDDDDDDDFVRNVGQLIAERIRRQVGAPLWERVLEEVRRQLATEQVESAASEASNTEVVTFSGFKAMFDSITSPASKN